MAVSEDKGANHAGFVVPPSFRTSSTGAMSRSATISSMNAERDRAAAAQQQAAANAGQMPDEPERDWSQGGKLRYTLGNIPIVTTLTLLTCLAIWCWELSDDSVPSRNSICWIPVVEWGEWHRVLSSAFLHASAIHILMNMYVVFTIGAAVEHQLGSLVMLGLVVLIVPLQNLLYLPIVYIATEVTRKRIYLFTCAVGYSGVLFALFAIHTALQMKAGVTSRRLGPINLPIWAFPILLLVLLSLFFPSISWQAHLAGLIIGALYVKGLLLFASLPRVYVLWIQENLVPAFLTRQRCWRNVPEQDPLEQFHFGFVTALASRCNPREPPACAGWCGCFDWCSRCFRGGPRGALDGMRGGQRLGGGAPAAGAGGAAAGRGGAAVGNARAPRVPMGVAAMEAPVQQQPQQPQQQAQPFSGPSPARFPSLPASALPAPSAPSLPRSPGQSHQSQQPQLQPQPQQPSQPSVHFEASRSRSSSSSQQGFSMGGGDGDGGGEYSRLMPSGDDSAAHDPPSRASAPHVAPHVQPHSARPSSSSRDISLLSPSRSAPLLDPDEQAFMHAQDL